MGLTEGAARAKTASKKADALEFEIKKEQSVTDVYPVRDEKHEKGVQGKKVHKQSNGKNLRRGQG
jgi:hypothetical protein